MHFARRCTTDRMPSRHTNSVKSEIRVSARSAVGFGRSQASARESQGQGGLDGEIRVPPLPTPPAAPAGRPGSDRFRGQPHRHIAASNKGLIVGRPVRNAILRLIRGMNLRLHPCSVAPAEGPEKCGPSRPTPGGSSCNNAPSITHGSSLHASKIGRESIAADRARRFAWPRMEFVATSPARVAFSDAIC